MDNMQQNINPNQNAPIEQSPSPAPQPPEKGGMGPLIGSVIVIVILVIGAIYFWGDKLNKQESNPSDQQPAATLSQNDDVNNLEQDLNNTPDIQIDTNNI